MSNELKVAITVIASVIVAVLGFRVMRDNPLFRQSHMVHAYFERVDGLNTGNYIYISGVKVGSVKEIELSGNDSVRVTLGFNLGVNLPKGSVAYLESAGLLNDKAIIVKRGDSDQQVEFGETIKGVYEGGIMETLSSEGEKISENVSSSFDKLNVFLDDLNKVLNEDNRDNISGTLSSLESTSKEISGLVDNKRSELEASIEHLRSILANVDTLSSNNRDRLDSTLVNMNRSLKELETLSGNLSQTSVQLNTLLEKINNGDGSLGMLVNNPSLYNNLDSLSFELKNLVKNINENPNRYLKNMRLIEVF